MTKPYPGKIISIIKEDVNLVIHTVSGGKYVYKPSTEESLCKDDDPEWRQVTIAAHSKLLEWYLSDQRSPCPAHISWNYSGQPLLQHHDAARSGGTIQPLVSGWESDKWLVDPKMPEDDT